MSNIGMMDGAFFVGRKEIVDWINQTLNVNLTKVEQTASGAIACQLLDAMHPGMSSSSITNLEPDDFLRQIKSQCTKSIGQPNRTLNLFKIIKFFKPASLN
jgi:hypothetical protein